MSKPRQRKIHLFNCDHVYELRVVADFLNATKQEHDLDFLVEEHYFSLPQISELSEKIIPELQIDFAVFVVHAHESRLSINEDDCGYTKVYRALLQATGGNVIIVIGGDDSYKDENEKDKEFISRWARRKMYLQFSEEFMDGRKSFIFSWDKKHRKIHEKALLHFFDPRKKGLKFEYQPLAKRPLPPRPTTPPSGRPSEPEAFWRPYSSLPAEKPSTGERVLSNKPVVPVESMAHRISDQDLVILGCSVSKGSMQAVTQVIKKTGPHLNLKKEPPVKNLPPAEINQYLERNSLKFCVLVVDAESVQDAYENLPKRRDEYEGLLKTAVNKVAEKVIILVYDDLPLKPQDEAIVHKTIDRIIKRKDKGFIAWVKKGRLTVDSNVLTQILKSESNTAQKMPQIGAEGQGQTNVRFDASTESRQAAHGDQTLGSHVMQPSGSDDFQQYCQQPQGSRTIQQPYVSTKPSSGEQVMLKSKLFHGNISYQKSLREIHPGFLVPPYVRDALLQQYRDISEAEVKIVADPVNGALRWIVNPKGKSVKGAAANEMLMLKTRVRDGLVSLEKGDLEYIYPNWKVPVYITESLYQYCWSTPNGELSVFSDEKGNLRYKVNVGAGNEAYGFAKKFWKNL